MDVRPNEIERLGSDSADAQKLIDTSKWPERITKREDALRYFRTDARELLQVR